MQLHLPIPSTFRSVSASLARTRREERDLKEVKGFYAVQEGLRALSGFSLGSNQNSRPLRENLLEISHYRSTVKSTGISCMQVLY